MLSVPLYTLSYASWEIHETKIHFQCNFLNLDLNDNKEQEGTHIAEYLR